LIESSERMIREQNNNPAISKHFELEIKTLQNTPRDPDKLEQLLQVKERKKEQQAIHIEDTNAWLQRRLKYSRLYCIW
jgi:hypothetical protein